MSIRLILLGLAITFVGVLPPLRAQDEMSYEAVGLVATGQLFDISVLCHTDSDIESVAFEVCVPSDEAVFTEWRNGYSIPSLNDGAGPDLYLIEETTDGYSVEIVLDDTGVNVMEAGLYSFLRLVAEAVAGDGEVIELGFCGDPVYVDEEGDEIELDLVPFSIDVVDGPKFARGDADGSGTASAIVDTLHLLRWAFQDGDEPPCMNAADFDGNRIVQPILDAMAHLCHFFSDKDNLPMPFPRCGADPNPDPLDCDEDAC